MISDEIKVSEKKILSVIKDFGLFKIENGYFYSESLNSRINQYLEKVNKLKANANKRWKKADNDNANAMQLHNNSTTKNESKSNAIAQILNEIKLNQTRPIKLNEIIKK